MNIVIASEKPSISRAIAPFARAHWPQDKITFVHVVPYGNLLFGYPRGLKASDFPYISVPKDRLRPWADWHCHPLELTSGSALVQLQMSAEILTEADVIVFACDPDHTGAVGFDVLLHQIFGDDRAAQCPAIVLHALDAASINSAVSNQATFGEVSANWLSYGRTKRYFDWNWNVNSLAVFGAAMRAVGVPSDAPPLSKYALQLLYGLREGGPWPEGEVVARMHKWPGTGRYTSAPGGWMPRLGSAASRVAIIENLLKAGLLEEAPQGSRPYVRIQSAQKGRALIEKLHPDCEDADLPFRLNAWCEAGFEKSKPAIDRYIRTVFGKQLRFSALKNLTNIE